MLRSILLTLALISTGCGGILSADSITGPASAGDTSQVSLSVDGMMCEESCAKRVASILADQSGIREVSIDFNAKKAICTVDEAQFDVDSAIANLADEDFAAKVN